MRQHQQDILGFWENFLTEETGKQHTITYLPDPKKEKRILLCCETDQEECSNYELNQKLQYLYENMAEENKQIWHKKIRSEQLLMESEIKNAAEFKLLVAYINLVFSQVFEHNKNRLETSLPLRTGVAIFSSIAALLATPNAVLIASCFTPMSTEVTTAMTFLLVAGVVYLSVLTYGIVNDLLAVRQNMVYFYAGHNPRQRNMFRSNHKNNVAIGWGIIATAMLALGFSLAMCAMAGVTYGLSAAIVAIGNAVSTTIPSIGTLPALVTLAVGAYALCHLIGTLLKAHKHALAESEKKRNQHYFKMVSRLDPYTQIQWRKEITNWRDASKAAGNNDRNIMGYNLLGFGKKLMISLSILLGASLIVGSIPQVQTFFTQLFTTAIGSTVSQVLSTYLPAAVGGILGAFVLGAIIYMAVTSNVRHRNQPCYINTDADQDNTPIKSNSILNTSLHKAEEYTEKQTIQT